MMQEIPYYLYAVLGLCAAGITYGLTIVLIKVMPRLGVMDLPDERKIHREPVPKLGGIALFVAIIVCLALVCAVSPMARHVFFQPRSIAVFIVTSLTLVLRAKKVSGTVFRKGEAIREKGS